MAASMSYLEMSDELSNCDILYDLFGVQLLYALISSSLVCFELFTNTIDLLLLIFQAIISISTISIIISFFIVLAIVQFIIASCH